MPTDDLADFCCQNPDCDAYGQRSGDNILVIDHYGKARHRLLYCRACMRLADLTETLTAPPSSRRRSAKRLIQNGLAAPRPRRCRPESIERMNRQVS